MIVLNKSARENKHGTEQDVGGDRLGIKEKILSYDPDTGNYIRMLKFLLGIETSKNNFKDKYRAYTSYITQGQSLQPC